MVTGDQINRLRSRAAYYRDEAGRAGERRRRIYCRALASHLEREASELVRLIRNTSRQTKPPPNGAE